MPLTTARRRKIPKSKFGLPEKAPGPGSYPLDTESRARNALSRAAQNASPAEEARIKRKVTKLYPGIEQGSGELTPLGQLTLSRFQERWGTGDGHQKFEEAINDGHISRSKMFREPQLRQRGKFARRAS